MQYQPTTSFGEVAPYYDQLMRVVPYRMWTSYYLLLLAHQNVRPKTVLDMCCGTGTMCELLMDEGLLTQGFDLSPGMIEAARRKAKRKKLAIRYEVQNAVDYEMGETYDAVLSFYDSLNNILDPDDLARCFSRTAAHLPSGGSFIFDLNTAYAFEADLFTQSHRRKGAKLQYEWQGHWNPATREITVDMQFWFNGEPFREVHRQRAYDEDEIRAMLIDAGFTEIRSFHSYTLNPPRYKSDRIHYTAIRV